MQNRLRESVTWTELRARLELTYGRHVVSRASGLGSQWSSGEGLCSAAKGGLLALSDASNGRLIVVTALWNGLLALGTDGARWGLTGWLLADWSLVC